MLVELHPLVGLKSLRLALIFVEIFYSEIVFQLSGWFHSSRTPILLLERVIKRQYFAIK